MRRKAPEEADIPETPEEEAPKVREKPRRQRRRVSLATLVSLAIACIVFAVLALAVSGRTLPVPEFVRAHVEEELNERLQGAPLRLGKMEFGVDRNGIPQLLMNNIRLADQAGGAVAELNWLGAELSLEQMMRGQFAAESLYLTGAQITIRRTAAGRFTLSAGAGFGGEEQTITDILARIDAAMSDGVLAELEKVVAAGVVITLEDARSGRIWQATNASATLRQSDDALSLSITSDVFSGTDDLANVQLSLTRSRETEHLQLGVRVDNMAARDIAAQAPVLAWLSVLDAPISGAVRTELDETGTLAGFAGTLDIAGGALKPDAEAPPVAFEAAKAYFTFDPAQQRIDFSEVTIQAEDGSIVASGHSYLTEFDGLWPQAYLGQFVVEDAAYAGGNDFEGPLAVGTVNADLRVRLDPFSVDFGQIVIDNNGTPIRASGRVTADDQGWHIAVDATTPEIDAAQVLEYWPKRVSPVTRGWLSRNLASGTLHAPAFGIRFDTGKEPDAAFSFEFSGGEARFLPEMPPLKGARGRAELMAHRFSLGLTGASVTATDGSEVDIAGSQFTVADTRPKPSHGQIDVAAGGALTSVLDILNNPPLRLMERAKRPVDLADAQARAEARITLPLKDGIETEEIGFDVRATLRDVASDVLVPDRVFTSPEMRFTATPEALGLEGPARLDGVPLTAAWRQPLGDGASAGGQITGQVSLSPRSVDAFDLPLPDGLLTGESQGNFVLTMPADPDVPPELELTSDLRGMSLGLAALGWRKPPSERGQLELTARLGDVPEIESLRLDTSGLSFEGDVELSETGALEEARFAGLKLGNWLNADVELTPDPAGGPPRVTVRGGTADLRQLDLGGQAGRDAEASGPIDLRLDRLTVSDGIALAPLTGRLRANPGGLSGTFEARLNGRTPVRGTLSPANAGTAVRLTSRNAAGVLRDAGLTPNARGGSLDLVLTPVVGAPSGTFDGQFLIEDIRLKDAPAMAELLDAVSVVGLLDQLGGPGIRFETIDGQFRLDRRQIRLRSAAAVGPSMGISADGLYDLRNARMDFRGVVSPVYFLNGIGSFLTRRGEGLFGFNYRMAGPAANPEVGVNPLSILTPGAFRQIFRRAPPGG